MINVIEKTGFNAGRVWTALNSCGPLTKKQVMINTQLRADEIHAAVGWLARENKIREDGPKYKLGQTNLNANIGDTIKKIWNEVVTEEDFFTTLGWLAREGQINEKTWQISTELRSLRIEIEEKQAESEALEAELVVRNRIIGDLQSQLIQNQTCLVENTRNIEDLEIVIEQSEKEIETKIGELEAKENIIFELRKEIEEKNIKINQMKKTLELPKVELEQDNLESVTTTLIEKDGLLRQLEKKLKKSHKNEVKNTNLSTDDADEKLKEENSSVNEIDKFLSTTKVTSKIKDSEDST